MSPQGPTGSRRPRNWPSVKGDPQQRASYALTRLEDISRLVAEWVWEVDTHGAFTYISERVTQDLGLLPSQLIGRKISDLGRFHSGMISENESNPGKSTPETPGDGAKIETGQDPDEPDWRTPFRDAPFEIMDGDGEVRRLLVSSVPIFNPETWTFEGACGTARDTTELRATRETKAYLEEANRLLRSASEAKSAFLANMSHELRTPLNAILGFAQMLSSQAFGPLGDKRYLEYARDIQESGEHLVGLVNEVLDLSAIEAGQLDLFETEVDVATVITGCIEMLHQTAEGKSLKLETDIHARLPQLSADARSIRQILLNLISNAIKFTPENGTITTSATIAEDGGLTIGVKDTGIGIPEPDLQLVLMPFGRGSQALTRNEQGIGLGLAITKSLTEKHGGMLTISSTVGVGTTIEIHFPSERTLISRK